LICREPGGDREKHDVYLDDAAEDRAVFEHYAAQSEYYKRANIVQRFAMEDVLYRLTMELLGRLLGRSRSVTRFTVVPFRQ